MKRQLMLCMVMIMALLAYQASAGCGKWVVRETTDYLTDPLFDEAVASSTGPNSTVSSDNPAKISNSTGKDGKEEGSSNSVALTKKPPSIDLAGKWKVKLDKDLKENDHNGALDLILIQSDQRLQGYGTLIEKGSEIPATATGSVSDEAVSLDIKLILQKKDYRLDLNLINSTLEGSYELYEGDKLTQKGDAMASKSGS